MVDASVVLLRSPSNLNVGIDYCIWKTGPKFMGIRRIPPGPHFVYWSLEDRVKDTDVSDNAYCDEERAVALRDEFRTGFFAYLEPGEVVVRQWNADDETFESMPADEEERYVRGVKNLDFHGNLGPYPMEWWPRWKELSRFITKEVIDRIEPICKCIGSSTLEYDESVDAGTSSRGPPVAGNDTVSDTDSEMVGNLDVNTEVTGCTPTQRFVESNDERRCFLQDTVFFCDIPRPRIKAGLLPSEVTQVSHDRSEVLNSIIESSLGGNVEQLLGELQLSFILFLLGQNYQAFHQWKSLVILLCHCDAAVQQRPQLFSDFIRVLHCHLTQAPDDFFADSLLSNNFLVQCLANLCELCSDSTASRQLQQRAEYIKAVIQEKFKMTIDELVALSEDAPIVVDPGEPLFDLQEESTSVEKTED